jgi:hypothetical protein
VITALDTANIKDELRDYAARNYETQKTIKRVLESRLDRAVESHTDTRWILKFITAIESGQNLDWVETELEWLESDGLPAVKKHFVDHAIALAKQAIANQTPSLV